MSESKPKLPDASDVLWENCLALMVDKWGKEKLAEFGKFTGIMNGGASRIKNRNSVRIDLIQRVAHKFNLQAWQLLVPGLDPKNPPVVSLTEAEKNLYERLKRAREAFNEER